MWAGNISFIFFLINRRTAMGRQFKIQHIYLLLTALFAFKRNGKVLNKMLYMDSSLDINDPDFYDWFMFVLKVTYKDFLKFVKNPEQGLIVNDVEIPIKDEETEKELVEFARALLFKFYHENQYEEHVFYPKANGAISRVLLNNIVLPDPYRESTNDLSKRRPVRVNQELKLSEFSDFDSGIHELTKLVVDGFYLPVTIASQISYIKIASDFDLDEINNKTFTQEIVINQDTKTLGRTIGDILYQAYALKERPVFEITIKLDIAASYEDNKIICFSDESKIINKKGPREVTDEVYLCFCDIGVDAEIHAFDKANAKFLSTEASQDIASALGISF